ncbi:unnamed protein product [Darwinula stevensoni]|uniref:Trichohyalin-plectin-homology domain-containing protein n=1 Tax=Darwinula stevensoni TaxID=69355 RepID=A0A7R8ZXC6_9CRUS|nr:unnamed protein product [Darwinula stevensoni]CAG0879087.1 unnamed protein product [Darwinula stevensoni]
MGKWVCLYLPAQLDWNGLRLEELLLKEEGEALKSDIPSVATQKPTPFHLAKHRAECLKRIRQQEQRAIAKEKQEQLIRQNSQEWHEACQKEMQADAMKSWEMQLKEHKAAKEYTAKENEFWNSLRSEKALLQEKEEEAEKEECERKQRELASNLQQQMAFQEERKKYEDEVKAKEAEELRKLKAEIAEAEQKEKEKIKVKKLRFKDEKEKEIEERIRIREEEKKTMQQLENLELQAVQEKYQKDLLSKSMKEKKGMEVWQEYKLLANEERKKQKQLQEAEDKYFQDLELQHWEAKMKQLELEKNAKLQLSQEAMKQWEEDLAAKRRIREAWEQEKRKEKQETEELVKGEKQALEEEKQKQREIIKQYRLDLAAQIEQDKALHKHKPENPERQEMRWNPSQGLGLRPHPLRGRMDAFQSYGVSSALYHSS